MILSGKKHSCILKNANLFFLLSLFLSFFLPFSAIAKDTREVIVYTTVDQLFAEPILSAFEDKHHITVKAVYDIEAVKTTGLVNRLIAEKNNPRCDVFWNSEVLRTIILKHKGIITPYISQQSEDIPASFKDEQGYWSGFASRRRVFAVNSNLVATTDYPRSLEDLTSPQWKGQVAMANPLFGTTAGYISSIFSFRGKEAGKKLLLQLQSNRIHIVDGNSVVRDMTGSGEVLVGLTDNDDVTVGKAMGLPIVAVVPATPEDVFLIPSTVALVSGAPHEQEAMKLIDYLMSPDVEQQLIDKGFSAIALHGYQADTGQNGTARQYDYEKMAATLNDTLQTAQQIFMN